MMFRGGERINVNPGHTKTEHIWYVTDPLPESIDAWGAEITLDGDLPLRGTVALYSYGRERMIVQALRHIGRRRDVVASLYFKD